MATEIMMCKRAGKLEPASQMWADDLATLPNDVELRVTITAPKNSKQLRFAWALAQKIADARDDILDKDIAMDVLCEMTRHVKMVVNPITNHAFLMRKSIGNLDGPALSRLLNRMVYVTVTNIVPGLDEGQLRDEIEAMVSGSPQHQREPA